MDDNHYEYELEQWKQLSENEKRNIVNHYWDPYNPSVGYKTKKEIIDDFIKETNIPVRQFGLKSFGWTVYMLYVVVDDSQIRVPAIFRGLPVNKGVIIESPRTDKSKVKFKYGGTLELNLTDKIMIG